MPRCIDQKPIARLLRESAREYELWRQHPANERPCVCHYKLDDDVIVALPLAFEQYIYKRPAHRGRE